MKGKIFKYDKATDKMVLVTDAKMIPLAETKTEDGTIVGFGLIEVPGGAAPINSYGPQKLDEQQRDNLREVLRMADQSAEEMERRDCIRVQERVAQIREQYGIDE